MASKSRSILGRLAWLGVWDPCSQLLTTRKFPLRVQLLASRSKHIRPCWQFPAQRSQISKLPDWCFNHQLLLLFSTSKAQSVIQLDPLSHMAANGHNLPFTPQHSSFFFYALWGSILNFASRNVSEVRGAYSKICFVAENKHFCFQYKNKSWTKP